MVTSWGHDEYMYQVLTRNKSTIPAEVGFSMFYPSIRFKSHGFKLIKHEILAIQLFDPAASHLERFLITYYKTCDKTVNTILMPKIQMQLDKRFVHKS